MSFEDLPADWPTRPVTDPEITADLLDLVVRDRDRVTGAVAILLCGPSGRMMQPVVVSLPPEPPSDPERRQPFDVMCQALRRITDSDADRPPGGLLVAVARSRPPLVVADDRRWQEAAAASCAENEVELLGSWLVTPAVIRPIPPERARHSA